MAKLLNILAASIGSGLVLGASIRLGETLGGKLEAGLAKPAPNGHYPVPRSTPGLLSRLDRLEEKVSRAPLQREEAPAARPAPVPEWQSVVAGMTARMDRQQSDVESIRQQVAKATRALDAAGNLANHLRGDLQNELASALDKRLDERLAALEARVHLKMEASQSQTLDAMVSAMENRMTPRIIRMESEIAGQTAAVSELRECAMQSERSVQRLLGVLERLVSPGQHDQAPAGHGGTAETPSGNDKAQVPLAVRAI